MNSVKSNVKIMLAASFLQLAGCGSGAPANTSGETKGNQNSPTVVAKLFTDVTEFSSIEYYQGYKDSGSLSEVQKFCGGVAAGDFNGDGLSDLFIVRGDLGPHLLYKNEGNNRYTEMAAEVDLVIENHMGCGPTFADVDGDNDLDLFIGGIEGDRSYLLLNSVNENGEQIFVDVTEQWGLNNIAADHTISASFGDYDGDGWLDLFLAHWGTPASVEKQHLFRNVAGTGFVNVTNEVGLAREIISTPTNNAMLGDEHDYSFLGTFTDINNDSYQDLLMVSDFGTSKAFINSGFGSFAVADESAIKDENGMGSAVGDYDNDGDLDWFVSAIFTHDSPGSRLYQNNSNNVGAQTLFSDRTQEADVANGGWAWAACFADFNADGYLDIFHVNGWDAALFDLDFTKDRSRLFISSGSNGNAGITFTEEASTQGVVTDEQGRSLVCFDSDNDGDIDILALSVGLTPTKLYRNNTVNPSGSASNTLSITLSGLTPNTQAAGARVFVETVGSTIGEQMREVQIGSNFTSQNTTTQTFGVGQVEIVDQVRIEWPDGRITVLLDVSVNQHLMINHPDKI